MRNVLKLSSKKLQSNKSSHYNVDEDGLDQKSQDICLGNSPINLDFKITCTGNGSREGSRMNTKVWHELLRQNWGAAEWS